MGHAVEVSQYNYKQEVLDCETPVLVDFWAPWCGPCKAMMPAIEKVAETYAGRVKVVKVNAEEAQEIARQNMVRALPTLILFKNGAALEYQVGSKSASDLSAMIEKAL